MDRVAGFSNSLRDFSSHLAFEDYIEANEDALESAQRLHTENQEKLKSQKTEVSQAQLSLEQAESKPDNTLTSIEIQQVNLEKLYAIREECEIVAPADGVITENNAKVGALPTGILFVIKDADDLYVSVNVKEYSLSEISVGQEVIITTDATDEKTFAATVDYISPSAVSEAGSTSVEFEVRAAFDKGDDSAVRIGMNAYADIITDLRESVYSVPLSAVVTDERGSFVYAPNGAERTEIPVEVGIKNTTNCEISGEGLHDGLEILTQPEALPESNMAGGPGMF